MDNLLKHDLGSLVTPKLGAAFGAATAGGTGDNTAVTGIAVDRFAANMPRAAVVLVLWQAALAQNATLTLKTCEIEQSADGQNWDATKLVSFADPGVVGTGGAGGSTARGMVKLAIDLSSAKRYVRFNHTPDLSAANTDTSNTAVAWVLSGHDSLPAV
ncbi:hypothetical protein [Bradyrhizobium sp. SZCCHNRI1003]|uniref:hypothetical protein n=1 Tax=Bradyrhizobium sp. SZCCHNRI1003 TaxID=3057275 RepID=UPI0029168C3D|nr:hypothetical protein [Bradyrhizobium sp. SZCCHNRI1003]